MTGLLRAELLRMTSRRLGRILGLVLFGIAALVQVRLFFVSHRGFDEFDRYTGLVARDALPAGVSAVAVACAIMAFVVGASFVGAEWHNGTMQALLFWEPRRGRVLFAKAVALVAVLLAFTLALQVFVYATSYVTAATRGSTEGLTGGVQAALLLRMLRGFLIVTITGLFGFGVAGLARITGAALGAALVYFVILEQLVIGLRPGWHRYVISSNITAVMAKRAAVFSAGNRSHELGAHIGGVRGAVTLGLYLALLLGAFYATFSRRDVT